MSAVLHENDHSVHAGYITVDHQRGRKLFFYFVTSERDPAYDPVVLWLNGGPGCSSFDGFLFEHGPLRFKLNNASNGLSITRNVGAWSQVANMLYLDSPAGVGLSYSATPEDYTTNDTHTAHDSNIFLRSFFQEFDEFAKLPFYISGESYAGVYVPTLVKEVLEGNANGQHPKIDLQASHQTYCMPILHGYLIGNGVTDPETDGNALVSFAHFKSLISTELHSALVAQCNGSYWDAQPGTKCADLLDELNTDVGHLNLYDILEPCYNGAQPGNGQQHVQALRRAAAAGIKGGGMMWPLGGVVLEGALVPNWAHLLGRQLGEHPPCLDHRELSVWLDDEAVRKALHAAPVDTTGPFQECTSRISYTHDLGSMIPTHRQLLKQGMRVLIYNGDHDMCVPHTGAETWTRGFGLPVLDKWRPWHENTQVAGYVVEYEGLTYATILGAGHFTPEMKPLESLAIFKRFLYNKKL
ncbi:peptidase S10, serine carboxypeptidase [Coccomyxa subellipsoidea C-169]|uniref:Carboxypeptidase n=1 Tax=Coccomyxa subellipsoidea (strain C-169) TaxID=574566 RepID=I0YUL9_COCSC|nr:peptidase S10, serine carboxypeptidase [Coccomyxa subellipsoidea C-169]EIE22088.1 peptidase S10, serine carboxypeptidase [Coccomyxa subellipsoidea C-169]|eukprot:XP_005646632.1 peptidase S10, serine carboxypeptidase [Coccomyxa subellipsoidea C-169]